jgi:hypothetical protein
MVEKSMTIKELLAEIDKRKPNCELCASNGPGGWKGCDGCIGAFPSTFKNNFTPRVQARKRIEPAEPGWVNEITMNPDGSKTVLHRPEVKE